MDILDIFAYSVLAVSMLWVHLRVVRGKEPNTTVLRIFLLDGIALTLAFIGFVSPDAFSALMQEDYIGEWTTFYAFGVSGLIAAGYLWSFRKTHQKVFSLSGIITLAVVGLCLVVAGEEISWGQRLFAFKPPDFFLEANYQQELNVHNLLKGIAIWGIPIESRHLDMMLAFAYGIVFPLFTRFLPFFKGIKRFAPALYLAPYFILVIVMEKVYPIFLTGEACEMYLGLLFLIHTHDAYPLLGEKNKTWHWLYNPLGVILFVFSLGSVTAPLLNLTLYRSDAAVKTQVETELLLLKADFLSPDADTNKIRGRSRVHKRIYTAIVQNYFRLPGKSLFRGDKKPGLKTDKAGMDRKDYFLDPWNNPYWVYYSRQKNVFIFYSFGPNRKRDSDFDTGTILAPDDLGVVFTWKQHLHSSGK